MKKVSYLLASAVSALATLASGAATARSLPELRPEESAARRSPTTADTIRVSQSAKEQIGTQAKPGQLNIKGGTSKPGILDPGGKKQDFKDTFSEAKGNVFHDHFKDKDKPNSIINPVTNPAGTVQKTFQRNKAIQKQQ